MLTPSSKRDARIALLVLGAGSVVAQVVLLREVLATFAGSEITAAVALGLWLVCTGVGSLLGARLDGAGSGGTGRHDWVIGGTHRRGPAPGRAVGIDPPMWQLAAIHLALAVLPFAMLAAMRALPLVAGVRGSALGLPVALVGSLAVYLPYGLLSGGIVPVLGRLASSHPPGSVTLGRASGVRWAYALDSAGAAGGGLLLGVALAAGLPHGVCLALAGLPHALMAARYGLRASASAIASDRPTRLVRCWPAFAAVTLVITLLSVGPWIDRVSIGWRYPGQEILLVRDTPFGQLAVTRTGAQRNLLQDAIPLTSTGDLSAETRVHPPLCQVPEGARVLLVGGSIAGSLRATMLHRPLLVDCVETDAAVFRLGRIPGDGAAQRPDQNPGDAAVRDAGRASGGTGLHGSGRSSEVTALPPFPEPALDAAQVRTFAGDGRAFIRRHRGAYDAILLHLPGPENAQLNRYYTEEFFREAHSALRRGGVVSFLLPSSPNYLGVEQLALERSITAAISRSFAQITILPGEAHLYMASDRPADLGLEPILAARGIVTGRLLDYDWAELSDPFRQEELRELLFGVGTSPGEVARTSSQGALAEAEVVRSDPGGHNPASRDLVNRDLAPVAFRHFLDLRARLDAGGTELLRAIVVAGILAAVLACVPGKRRKSMHAGRAAPSPAPSVPAMPGTAWSGSARPAGEESAPEGGPPGSVLWAVMTSGFAAMALELSVLLLFQVMFGNLYLRLSLLITLFLGGGAIGAWIAPRMPGAARTQMRLADAAVALIAVALLVVGKAGTASPGPGGFVPATQENMRWIAGYLLLPALALLASVPMGVQFAAAGRGAAGARSPLGRLYLADLAGAAAGTLVTGLWLLPRGGIPAVIGVVVAIKMASLGLQFLRAPARLTARSG